MEEKKKYLKTKQAYDPGDMCGQEPRGLLRNRERRLKDLEQLTLVSVKTQYVISKVTSHGARLDVLAEDTEKILYHLEIEGADTADHARRTRLYGALTDGEFLRKGKDYSELPERYLFYISRKDIWKGGCTVYEEEKRFRQQDSRIRTVPI